MPTMPADDLLGAVEIIKGKLYIAAVRSTDTLPSLSTATNSICFSIDNELLYEPFFADFGPLNLGLTYRYCTKLDGLLANQAKQPEGKQQKIVHCTASDPYRKANSATLMGIYCTLYLGWSADEAYKPLMALKPFAPFRDASCGASSFHLTVLDCIRGMEKAKSVGFVDFHLREGSTFNLEEYEYYEQVENGDLNWILPGKFIAFSGPSAKRTEFYGYRTLVPEDYWDFWRKCNVSAVVRLNKKLYDKRRFTDGGFRLHELYFPDGSCPSEAILRRFIELAEAEPGVLSVHCKAGLGRTGVLICCYIMKHYKFTANEVIGYIRICRPGSVIGPQQHYLKEMEQKCWRMGDQYRAQMQARSMRVENALGEPSAVDYGDEDQTQHPQGYLTSPMKAKHSGTRPSASREANPSVNAAAVRMSQMGFTASSQSGSSGYRAVGSGAAAVAAANGTLGAGARLRSLGGREKMGCSMPHQRRPSPQTSPFTRRPLASTFHTEPGHHNNRYESPSRFGGGAPSYHYHSQSVDHSSSPTAWQGGARGTSNGRPQPSGRDQLVVSAGIAGPTGGLRSRTSSAGSRGGASGQLASPTGVPGSAPGVSRSSNSPFAGRIVAPNGQPRKGAAAVQAAMASSAYGGRSYGPGPTGNGSPYAGSPYGRATTSPLRARN
mmetsp:Transcript_47807/g.88970  ORF Transcript_47807/g.88970 Transcript_47807/m.88970 type:complete len:663 (-) Transcript_47807:447-2435(-)|eukprot:CAMPEP_0114284328 /NCGR_PEP_ID=MMETSP0059-20121206/4592_1 /TAXON_ID=36894 /ORGANISM="Pyramimonas parkeae, Strain CCMP726" /LENGTH=662 /DNA_ID=CAMNT_0001405147 /DNA_START=527 /DNA_END=2515 /DNA_ORIENTATION=-